MSAAITNGRKTLAPLLDHLSPLYTPNQLTALLQAYTQPRKTTFRVNSLKLRPADIHPLIETLQTHLSTLRFPKTHPPPKIVRCPWNRLAFQISHPAVDVRHLIDHPAHKDGSIHFQSWSSMIPPLCLDPPKGARVLDMCAAPGGKTFMLLEAVRHEGLVIANDLDRERLTRLVKAARNLVPHGMASALELRIGDGRKFHLQNPDTTPENTPPTEPSDPPPSWHIPSKHQGKPPPLRFPSTRTIHQPFTHILLDTPCTGTGTISLREPTTYKHWSSPTSLQYLQKLTRTQKSLLQTGLSLLAPSGTLVYSTCAISVEENEQVVSDVLEEFGEGKVEIVDVGAPERGKAFGSGVGSYGGRRFVEGMERCLRVFPDGEYEGFFVCKLRKVG